MAKNIFQRIGDWEKRLGKWFWVILAAIAVVVLVLIFRGRGKKEVTTAKVERGLVKQELVLTGSINAEKYATLYFPTSGKISWIGVKEGDKVNRGQALISLDKTVLAAAYQQALNNRRNTQAAVNNVHDQLKDNDTTETFSEAATRVAAEVANDNAWDALKAAAYNLSNSTLYAPFTGVVSSLPFDSPGVNVSFTDAQVVIVDPATIYFDVDADQNDVTSLKEGQEVSVVLDSYQDKEITGKVSFIAFTPKVGETGTSYKVKVVFDKVALGDFLPRVGMTGDAKFTLSQKDGVLYVPSDFVKSDITGKYIKLGAANNKTYIDTGLTSEERTEIISDKVKEGDTVYD